MRGLFERSTAIISSNISAPVLNPLSLPVVTGNSLDSNVKIIT